jgi:hypothetical protein
VCQLFDVEVLYNIEAVSDDENDFRVRPCVALGEISDYAAGFRGYEITPWFSSEEELDEFCECNINSFHIAACEIQLDSGRYN